MTTLLKDHEVNDALNQYREMQDGEQREALRNRLADWSSNTKAEIALDKDRQFERLYSGFDSAQAKLGGRVSMLENTPDPEESLASGINRRFVSEEWGKPLEEVSSIWPAWRSAYSLREFGKWVKSDKELYSLIADKVVGRGARREQSGLLLGDVALGMFDELASGVRRSPMEFANKYKEENPDFFRGLSEGQEKTILENLAKTSEDLRERFARHAPAAKRIFEAVMGETGRQDGTRQGYWDAVAELSSMDPEDKQAVYAATLMAAKRSGLDPKRFLRQFGQSLMEGTIGSVRQSARVAYEESLRSQIKAIDEGARMGTENPEDRERQKQEAQDKLKVIDVVREMEQLAQEADPIQVLSKSWLGRIAEKGAYGAASSIGYLGASMVPVVGPLLTFTAIRAGEYERIRGESPDLDPEAAGAFATVSALPQTLLELFKAEMFLPKVPVFRELLGKMAMSEKGFAGGAKNFLKRWGVTSAAESAAEIPQNFIPLVVDQIGAALNENYAEHDFQEDFKTFAGEIPETVISMMYLSIFGSGLATMSDVKHGRFILSESRELEKAGLPREEAAKILAMPTFEERANAFTEAYKTKRTAESIARGIRMANEDAAKAKQTAEENEKRATIETERDGEDGLTYVVRDTEGSEVWRTQDAESAHQAWANEVKESTIRGIMADEEMRKSEEGRAREIRDKTGRQIITGEFSQAGDVRNVFSFQAVQDHNLSRDDQADLAKFRESIRREGGNPDQYHIVEPVLQAYGGQDATGEAGRAFLDGFEKLTGRRVSFFRAGEGSDLAGGVVHGLPGRIWINADANRNLFALVGHEWGESIKAGQPEMWSRLQPFILSHAEDARKQADALRNRRYSDRETLDAELTNNMIGDAFADPEFWKTLATKDKGLFERILEAIKQWFASLSEKAANSEWGTQEFTNRLREMHEGLAEFVRESAASEDQTTAAEGIAAATMRLDSSNEIVSNEVLDELDSRLFKDSPGDSRGGARDAAQSAQAFLRGSDGASGSPESGKAKILEWAKKNGRLISKLPWKLDGPKDKGQGEHHVFYDKQSSRWVKITKGSGSAFGRTLDLRGKKWSIGRAAAIEYLERIRVSNALFGDDTIVHGVFADKHGNVNIVTSQSDKGGKSVSAADIEEAMKSEGFHSLRNSSYYRIRDNMLILDLHEDNAVHHDGKMRVFDAIALHPSESQRNRLITEGAIKEEWITNDAGNINAATMRESALDVELRKRMRNPEQRVKILERAREKLLSITRANRDVIEGIATRDVSVPSDAALDQLEQERAATIADVDLEEKEAIRKSGEDITERFAHRIEGAKTEGTRRALEREAKARATERRRGIEQQFAERRKAVEADFRNRKRQVKTEAARAEAEGANQKDRETSEARLIHSLEELNALLSVFPPEIRGKVGGFVTLAKSSMTEKALTDFFVKRIDMVDRELERMLKREYDAKLKRIFKRAKPVKGKPGEKPKGKAGADIHALFDVLQDAVNMSAEEVEAHLVGIDSRIASIPERVFAGKITEEQGAEEEAHALMESALVGLVGNWRNADADRRATAIQELSSVWEKGYREFQEQKIADKEHRKGVRAALREDTGMAGTREERKARAAKDNGFKKGWEKVILNLLNFEQVSKWVFGENSEWGQRIADMERKASNQNEDAVQEKMEAMEKFFTDLAGGNRLAGERLQWGMSQDSMNVDGNPFSEMEAITALMMWRQEDGRRHMIGRLDEVGKPAGEWHYDQAFIDKLESQLSDNGRAVMRFLSDQYESEYAQLNAVFRALNGINLPQNRNYSPLTVKPQQAKGGMTVDPVTGNTFSAGSTTPGSLRTRGKAIAEPEFRDALQTWIAHTKQMEHWKAYAPFIAETRAILGNRELGNSIEAKAGKEAVSVLNGWMDYFSQGGSRDASAHLALNQSLSKMTNRAAAVALTGRIGVLAIQSTQLGAALAEIPLGAYVSRMGKLMSGKLGWGEALKSDYIQRRIKKLPPIVRQAVEGLHAEKPNALRHNVARMGRLIGGVDAFFTAGTYAIVFDYQMSQAKGMGLEGAEAETYAREAAERAVDRVAQPTRAGARSIYENTSTHPLARLGWAFASEARKNLAVMAYAMAKRPAGAKLRALSYAWLINAGVATLIRTAWRDMRDDDDEEWFDTGKHWSPKRLGLAMLTEPLYGIPAIGEALQSAIYAASGEWSPQGDLLSSLPGAASAMMHLPETLTGDRETEEVLRDAESILTAIGLFNSNVSATASLSHLARDLFGVGKNVAPDE